MAIWHFRLILVPTRALRAKFGVIPIAVPQESDEDFTVWWSAIQPREGFEASIDGMLPRKKSWSEEMWMWGRDDGDEAYVCYDSEGKDRTVEEIGFRIDVGALSPGFVRDICALAIDLECMLLTDTCHVKAPEAQVLLAAIKSSTAQRYLDDPVATLRGLSLANSEVVQLRERVRGSNHPRKDGKKDR